ncbi:unnamed protein product, partial [Didymodactylos carnosus]
MATFSTTSKSKPLLIHDGFSYIRDKTHSTKIYWKCEESRDSNIKCEARVNTDLLNTVIFVNNKSHLHSANAIKLEVRKGYEDLRYRAINSNEPPANIVANSFGALSTLAQAQLPSKHNLKRLVKHHHLQDFLNYFEDTYIGRLRANGIRANPKFAVELWNMHSRTDQAMLRSN